MRVLVTGASGFIGSELVPLLRQRGDTVIEAARYAAGRFNFYDPDRRVLFDLRDSMETRDAVLAAKPDVIIHLAAQSAVAYSFTHPQEVNEVNYMGTVRLADAAREAGAWFIMAGTCYDEQTRAFVVGEGFKRWDELSPGDHILALDPTTGLVRAAPIEHVTVAPYRGELLHFKSDRVDLAVTPNHRMLLRRNIHTSASEHQPGPLEFMQANEAAKKLGFYLPEGQWDGQEPGKPLVPSMSNEDVCYLTGLFVGDGYYRRVKHGTSIKTGLRRQAYLASVPRGASGRFQSIPLARPGIGEVTDLRAYLYIPEDDPSRARVEAALARCGIRWSNHGPHGMLYLKGPDWYPLAGFFAACGHGAHEKRIPKPLLNLPTPLLRSLLRGLLDSDGDRRRTYTTVSHGLVADIVELATKLGYSTVIREQKAKTKTIKGRVVQASIAYEVYLGPGRRYLTKYQGNASSFPYTGTVWCATVPGFKNFLVERNGKVAFCGNSEIYGRADSQFPLTEEQPMGGTSPYAASKIAAIEYLRVLEKTYQLPVTIMAPFNTIGRAPVNNRHFVVERACTQAIEEQHIDLHDPRPYRDFCFRSDHAEAYLAVLDHREAAVGQLFNICTGGAVSIGEMAELVARYVGQRLGKPVKVSFSSVPDRPLDITRLQGSNEKARRLLGWTPQYSIEQALERAADEWIARLGVVGRASP